MVLVRQIGRLLLVRLALERPQEAGPLRPVDALVRRHADTRLEADKTVIASERAKARKELVVELSPLRRLEMPRPQIPAVLSLRLVGAAASRLHMPALPTPQPAVLRRRRRPVGRRKGPRPDAALAAARPAARLAERLSGQA